MTDHDTSTSYDTSRNFVSVHDLTRQQVYRLFDLAAEVKASPGDFRKALDGKTLGMIFQKSSTRTRVSFTVAMARLGGQTIDLNPSVSQVGRRKFLRK